jgi:subfamily B ATP-binding cassette protein MsbA
MNTYLRILAYAKPWRRFVPGYLIFSLLAVAFGLMNMALLKPLLDVIFDQKDQGELSEYAVQT